MVISALDFLSARCKIQLNCCVCSGIRQIYRSPAYLFQRAPDYRSWTDQTRSAADLVEVNTKTKVKVKVKKKKADIMQRTYPVEIDLLAPPYLSRSICITLQRHFISLLPLVWWTGLKKS